MSDPLHLVKVPIRQERLIAFGRQRGMPIREVDNGYLCHCVLRELWQERAPGPFVVRGEGRALAIWGYTHTSAAELIAHAHAFADPSPLGVIDNPEAVASKRMPTFKAGQQLGFLLRVCPIVRLAKSINGHREGAEVDAFLARCFGEHSDPPVSREAVYQEWLLARLNQSDKTGVTVTSARMAAFSRERMLRRTHGRARQATCLERPDVRFEGNLIVDDGARFNDHLAHGVGRHRAFGFGALILVPPGTSHRP